MKYLLLIKYKWVKALMEIAWSRGDSWTALYYKERLGKIKRALDDCNN